MELRLLKEKLRSDEEIAQNHFEIAKEIAIRYNYSDSQNISIVQDLVLRAMDKSELFDESIGIIDSLARELGLFPYLEPDRLSLQDLLAYEVHRVTIADNDIVFHGPQAEVYYKLINGQSIVLSAPTSFGKSLIIDALISSDNFDNIVIVVPTIALIDETRRRLSKFNNNYRIITHSLQKTGERNIYILTQERVLEENFIGKVDFFVIDEFYKLSPWADSGNRCALLNEAFYRLYKKCNHFYMLGPNIEGIAGEFIENVKFEFIKFNYNTVVTEFHDHTTKNKEDKLIEICKSITGQTIVFCSSPARANEVARQICSIANNEVSPQSKEISEWVSEKYHKDWVLSEALRHGVAIHHARIPRGVSQYLVDLFNDGKIDFLVCTSTLIEGVNTSTKNIICYDDNINRKKFDIFTFNNIAGRSGRMFRHFIGHVYILSPPPQARLPFVDIPVYTQGPNTPESLLVNIDQEDLSEESKERIKSIIDQKDLSIETIRTNKTVDPREQISFAKIVNANIFEWAPMLAWKGYPTYEQLSFICNCIWDYFSGSLLGNRSVFSAKQLAFKINEISLKKSIKQLVEESLAYKTDQNIDDVINRILDFQRLWVNFHFPRLLRTIESIVNESLRVNKIQDICDYSAYSMLVENYFFDSSLVALEEYGLPLEVGKLFEDKLSTEGELDKALSLLKNINNFNGLSSMDIKFIRRAQNGISNQ
ncbi:MAG: DEAD/DEAH box helicase [Desulfobulbus sp.]|nr:DEAD/DEAH box helicase [Desulfobulbus sp.]